MIIDSITALSAPPVFIRLQGLLNDCAVNLKIEGLNVAGSIKLKTARQLIESLESTGRLRPGCQIVESSSGNLGLALALICAERRFRFTCVTDPNVSPMTARLMRTLGARVIVVTERDASGGFLQTRLQLIKDMVARDPGIVWTNQYANPSNPLAHYRTTAPEILREFPKPNWIFIGAGTTGTLGGCARYLREHVPGVRIMAVDPVGSVTFGGAAGVRYLPGIGTSSRPELADESLVDGVIRVPEVDAVKVCRDMARRRGLLLGASSGSVLAAVMRKAGEIHPDDVVVAISPDLGDRYLDTVYDDDWLSTRLPDAVEAEEQRHAARPTLQSLT